MIRMALVFALITCGLASGAEMPPLSRGVNVDEYAIVCTPRGGLPLLPREEISEYSFTHIDYADVGYNSEHSWTTDRMPEIRVDIEKRERVNARDEADRKQEEERDANLFGICAINDNRWDRTSTYIDCPICGRKMWIRVSDEIISGLRE